MVPKAHVLLVFGHLALGVLPGNQKWLLLVLKNKKTIDVSNMAKRNCCYFSEGQLLDEEKKNRE